MKLLRPFHSVALLVLMIATHLNGSIEPLTTPCGSRVGIEHPGDTEYTAAQKAAIKDALDTDFPEADYVSEATITCYCDGYAWAGADFDEGNIAYWVYIDSYHLDALNGHQLTYEHCLTYGPTHHAVDLDPANYLARSKWGTFCVMEHDWDYVPDGRACSLEGLSNYADYGSVAAIYGPKECSCSEDEDCEY